MERLSSTPFKQKTKDIFKSYRDSMRVYNIAKEVKDIRKEQDKIIGNYDISKQKPVSFENPKEYKKYIDLNKKQKKLTQESNKLIPNSGYFKNVKNPKLRSDFEMIGTENKRPSMPKLPKRSIQSVKTQTSSPEIKKSKRKLFKKGKSEYLNIETGKQVKIKRETKRKRIFPKPRKVLNLITGKRNIVQ